MSLTSEQLQEIAKRVAVDNTDNYVSTSFADACLDRDALLDHVSSLEKTIRELRDAKDTRDAMENQIERMTKELSRTREELSSVREELSATQQALDYAHRFDWNEVSRRYQSKVQGHDGFEREFAPPHLSEVLEASRRRIQEQQNG